MQNYWWNMGRRAINRVHASCTVLHKVTQSVSHRDWTQYRENQQPCSHHSDTWPSVFFFFPNFVSSPFFFADHVHLMANLWGVRLNPIFIYFESGFPIEPDSAQRCSVIWYFYFSIRFSCKWNPKSGRESVEGVVQPFQSLTILVKVQNSRASFLA